MNEPLFFTERTPDLLYDVPSKDLLALAYEQAEDIMPSCDDDFKIALLLVDFQVDFCHPKGNLYLPGALDDVKRTASFIYRNLDAITTLIVSIDSHLPNHIFFAPWWIDEFGEHPEPFTIIRYADIVNHRWIPMHDHVASAEYVKFLEENGRHALCIWPYHCLLGTQGKMVMPMIADALVYHSIARTTNPIYIEKGTTATSEYYGVFFPEVPLSNHHQVEINQKLLDVLSHHDRVYVAGQAKSHCVLETLKQLSKYLADKEPAFLKKVYLLDDCCSILQHPTVDFNVSTEQEFCRIAKRGMRRVMSRQTINIR